jgi:hypothetical protein
MADGFGTSGMTVTLTSVAVHNTVLAFLGGVSMDTMSPTIAGFVQIGTIPDPNGYGVGVWGQFNSAGGTVPAVASYGATSFTSLVVCEVSGVTTSPLIGATNNSVSPGSPSTDDVSVGPPTPNNTGNAIVISYSLADTGNSPTTGTGFTGAGTFIDFGGGNISALEYKNVTSPSSAATWTSTANGDLLINFVLVLDTSVAGGCAVNVAGIHYVTP